MTLDLIADTGSIFSVEMDEDYIIRKVWVNDVRMNLTPWREWVLYKRLEKKYDLVEEAETF